ncbi:MAG TPA: AAA family ATPase [Solirubrobacteraceae bacterium]|nr:AAA family ATPase [Solirubrobacteraceae bacterium]
MADRPLADGAEHRDDATLTGEAPEPVTIADGRYRIEGHLGQGTSKRVHLARDLELDRQVALSFFTGVPSHEAQRERVWREVRTMARLGDHAHTVTVHDIGEHDGTTYLVCQFLPGGSVAGRLRTHRSLPVRQALRIARDTADALAYAHAHGIVHRDVKPSNIWLGDDDQALLGDFGVALVADSERITREHAVLGTAAYMAPEQATAGAVDARSDLYSLGASLFEMLCGRPPFVGRAAEVILQVVHTPPPDLRDVNADVPEAVARFVARLLSKRPDDRPASATEARDTLDSLLTHGSPPARPAVRGAPLPRVLQTDPERPLVGRDAALEALDGAWMRVGGGRARLVLVAGEAGIGKTRLAAAFAERVYDASATVLYGRCDEDPLVSYQPFVEALRHQIRHVPSAVTEVDPELAPELAELSGLIPELRGRIPAAPKDVPTVSATTQRYRLFEAAFALMTTSAGTRPLLLVIDDLQWIDKATGQLLRHLLRAASERAMMVLATVRTERPEDTSMLGLPALHPLADVLDALRSDPGLGRDRVETLPLAGLDVAGCGALVSRGSEAAPDSAPDSELVQLLHERTSGNPFFIEETLRGLAEADVSATDDAAAALDRIGVPAGALGVIERRLARLSPAAAELLTLASVFGREVPLDLIGELLGTPGPELPPGYREVLAAGLVVERGPGRFTFCHALVREALYRRRLTDADRARLHLRVGEALEQRRGDDEPLAAELAHHFHAAAEVGGAEKAIDYARQAAKSASAASAHEEGAQQARRALDVLERFGPERDAERCRLLLTLARAQWQLGELAAARTTCDAAAELARRLGDPHQLARAALGFGGRWYDVGTVDEPLVALLEEALAALPPDDGPVRARLLARLADAQHFSSEEGSVALSAQAIAMARRLGDEDALVHALAGRHTALLHCDHLDERLAIGEEWLALATAAEHGDVRAQALHWRIFDLVELGDMEAARRHHGELSELAERLRQPLYRHFAAAWEAKWLEMAGRFEDAKLKADLSYDLARRAQAAYAESNYAGQLFGLARDRGRLGQLLPSVQPLIGENPRLGVWRAGFVLARLESGDAELARAELARLAQEDFANVPRDLFWLGAMCLLAEAAAALGDDPASRTLLRLLTPHAERNAQIGLAMYVGPVRRFLGLLTAQLGAVEDARAHFEAALRASTAMGAATAEAHVQCELGALLLAYGDVADHAAAIDLLRRSHDTAGALEMAPLMRRADRLLALAGAAGGRD